MTSTYFLELFYALLLLLLYTAGSIHGFNRTILSGQAKCIETEKQALLNFQQRLRDYSGMLSTWRQEEINGDCCKWKGIKCHNETGHVQMLDLHASPYLDNLQGVINITLLIELQYMEYLDLSGNFFIGSQIPDLMGSFSNLRYLNLSNADFQGRIPSQLGKLAHLRHLDLSHNCLVGAIPFQLGNLLVLQSLRLGNNYGLNINEQNHTNAEWLFNLTSLTNLDFSLSDVGYSHHWLQTIGKLLPKLRELRLGGCSLSDNHLISLFHPHLNASSSLTILDLSHNKLTSSALPWLSNFSFNLQELYLSDNNFVLQSSSNLNFPSLVVLDLSYNKLTSIVQGDFNFSSKLQMLFLQNCSLTSLFHPHSNASSSLTILDLSRNMLTSSTLPWLSNFGSNLQELYLSDNNFVWQSSFNLHFPSLVVLDLSYNKQISIFQGDFNFSSKFQMLYLEDCSLTSFVPSASNMNFSSSLTLLDLSSNMLASSAIFNWLSSYATNLRDLDLSYNLLEDHIPKGFGNMMNSLQRLDLSVSKLQGEIPTSFGNISTLHTLDLRNNNLSGMLPNFTIFSSLRALDLSNNRLIGEIPKSIGLLSELEYLELDGNSLEGDVTELHLTNLSKLKILDLSGNSLSLKFGTSWVPPFQLVDLRLPSCKLGPTFPSWLQTQSYFLFVDISDAGIIDSVPEWFWHISQNIHWMNISYNALRGIIPNLPLEFTNFPTLILTSNQFEGSIPSFMLTAATLQFSQNRFSDLESFLCGKRGVEDLGFLDVSNNQLKGQLPDCWNHLSSLQHLDVSNNKLSGKIPLSMGTLVNLEAFILRKNSLIGGLPSSMKNLTNLFWLDMGENKLSGPIPSWIGESLQYLVILSLRVNHFSGSLPSQLCYLTHIQLLDLSKNNFSEEIPTCLKNFTVMANMSNNLEVTVAHYYHNNGSYVDYYDFYILLMWKGVEDVFKNPDYLLKSIDLSSNNLNGEIPTEIGSLFGLVSLNLSRNNLSGEITSELGNLKSLDFLDLSQNHLSGRIPSSLAQIDRLSVLDLSDNHLIGRIPTGTQLQSFNASSYEGNLDLCGKPLEKVCPEDEAPVTDVPFVFDREEESIFSGAFYMSLGLGFAVGFWGFIGPLLFCHSWRYSYIRFLNKLSDNIYVMMTLYVGRCNRWFTS